MQCRFTELFAAIMTDTELLSAFFCFVFLILAPTVKEDYSVFIFLGLPYPQLMVQGRFCLGCV